MSPMTTTEAKAKRPPVPTYDLEYVRAVSAACYRSRFSEFDRQRIIADPERGEEFFVRNSGCFDSLTRHYLDIINEIGLQPRAVRDAA
jgi:hypothetical protein